MNWIVLGYSTYAVLSLGSMATMSLGIGVLVACLLVGLGGPKALAQAIGDDWRRNSVYRGYFWLALALAGACAISLVAAAIWPLGYGGKQVVVHFGRDMAKAWYLFWPLLLYTGLSRVSEGERGRIVRAWLLAFGLLSVIGIVQHFTGWPRPQAVPNFPGRFHATLFMGHHLSVASILIFPFFAALDLGFRKDAAKLTAGLTRPWLLVMALAGGITLFLTFSRILWVALPAGLALWAALALPRRWVLALLSALLISGLVAFQSPLIRERAFSQMGTTERYALWSANWEFFKERPLTGAGWHHNAKLSGAYLSEKKGGGSVFSGHAHNNVIEQLGGMGLIGLVAWLAWWLGVIAWTVRARSVPGFARGILCAWFVFQLNGLTQVNFWESKVLHQQAWMIAFVMVWVSSSSARRKAKSS